MTIYRSEREGQKHSMSQRSGEKKQKTLAKWNTRCPAAKPKFHATLPEGVLPDSGTVG